jgi:hypothetical protein
MRPRAECEGTRPATLLDRVMPDYEFAGRAGVWVHATPEAVFAAFDRVTTSDMPLATVLGTLRYLPPALAKKPRAAPAPAQPFLTLLLEQGNIVLAREPDHELVLGAIGRFHQVLDQQLIPLHSADEFAAFTDPSYQKLAMSVRVEERKHGELRLSLEHRTHALSPAARRAFARYWVLIYPFGNFVSWLLLRAVRRLAEQISATQDMQAAA